jgi:hypothetical protein
MRIPISGVGILLTLAAGCVGDRSITRGADGSPEWDRRLAAAIPIGIPLDSAKAVMLRNGFRCELGADGVRYLWCDKNGGGRFSVVRRRWQAVLNLDTSDRIARVRATTDLTGP